MKKIKIWSMMMLMTMAMPMLVACGGDDNGGNTTNSIVGTWICSESDGSWSETRTYVFNNNGTGTYRQKGRTQKDSYDESSTFNYTVAPTGDNSGIIKIVFISGNYTARTFGKDYFFSYNMNGNTLFLNIAYGYGDSSIETYTRK